MDRRGFLTTSAILGGIGVLGLDGLMNRSRLSAAELRRGEFNRAPGGYGDLTPKPAKNNGETWLALPEGFEYTAFGHTGTLMADGHPTPSAHDGMATFAVGSELRLVRNHETRQPGACIADPARSYDPKATGGTTTLVVDPETRELVRDFVSLSGTIVNCAGGPTPWGSWVSCEETTIGPETSKDYDKAHGYLFEVPAASNEPVDPVPLKAMGRRVHEAMAVDPATGIVYITEDRGASGLYRFIPNTPGVLASGGRLQMLAVAGKPQFDTRVGQKMGDVLSATWVDIEDPDPATAGEDPGAVYFEGFEKGAATFARLEGCWFGHNSIFVNCTSGGDKKLGQVWRYIPKGDGGDLVLVYESIDANDLESPDNLCVSPRGGLVICEDGDGTNFLRGLTLEGQIFDLAQNVFNESEFAGSTFSPDGKTLFVNIQTPGVTLAIWGPWERGAV